jgi:hypothetical protein
MGLAVIIVIAILVIIFCVIDVEVFYNTFVRNMEFLSFGTTETPVIVDTIEPPGIIGTLGTN